MTPDRPLLEVNVLKKHFPIYGGLLGQVTARVYAVDGVSFSIKKGETLSLVGESGCGKSTVGKAILRLFKLTDGEVYLDGERMEKSGACVDGPWRYEVIPGASHWIPLDAPDRLNELLLDWLR